MKQTLLALCLFFLFSACKKDSTSTQLTNTQLLTAHTWQVYETIQQVGNTQTMYKKGGINTTGSDYSKVRLAFKADGTGSLTDPLNNTYSLTWAFTTGDESKMTVTINYSTPTTLSYMLISLTSNSFSNTLYYSVSGQQALATSKYIPYP
jgi:hypothetical protein